MIILGIDQSTRKTGWAIMDDYTLVESGVIRADLAVKKRDTDDIIIDRICYTIKELGEIVERHEPKLCVIEEVNAGLNKATALKLSGLFWSIRYAMKGLSIDCYTFHPTSWRSLLWSGALKRKAAKERAIAFVDKHFGVSVSDDEAEAICIALAYKRKKSELFDGDKFNGN